MMRKWGQWAVVGVILFSLVATYAMAAEKELRVVGSWSSLTLFRNFEQPFWTRILPQAMGGKIRVSMTSLGQVKLKGAAVLRQMNMGVFDVVHTVADYVVTDSPALAGLDLPGLAPDIATARKVVEAYRPVLEEYLRKDFNAQLLTVVPYPAQVLFSRVEIKGLDDLKGKKVRASGWTTSEFVTAIGARGMTLSFSEVPQALERGVVECAVTGTLSGYMAGWGEVSKYLYPLPIGGWDYVIGCMSLKTWNSFTKEEQAKIKALIKEKLEDPAWAVTERETQEGIDCLTGGPCPHGAPAHLKLVPISEKDIQKTRQILVEKGLPAWAKQVGPEVVKKWNETIGKVVGLKAEAH